jgi:hypothetical protein
LQVGRNRLGHGTEIEVLPLQLCPRDV